MLKELKEGDHGDPDLLNHLNKVLDESIHATGLLFKVLSYLFKVLSYGNDEKNFE